MATTAKGFRYPVAGDANNVPNDIQNLASDIDQVPGIAVLTTTARNALSGAGLWNKRLIYNTNLGEWEAYNTGSVAWDPVLTQFTFNTWVPQVDQGATTNITKTINEARYARVGSMCVAWVDLGMTGAGTASNAVTITLPLTASGHSANQFIGTALYYDSSLGEYYTGGAQLTTTTKFVVAAGGGGVSGIWGQALTNAGTVTAQAVASGDVIRAQLIYNIA